MNMDKVSSDRSGFFYKQTKQNKTHTHKKKNDNLPQARSFVRLARPSTSPSMRREIKIPSTHSTYKMLNSLARMLSNATVPISCQLYLQF